MDFSDLIPQRDGGGLSFDDLIPPERPRPARVGPTAGEMVESVERGLLSDPRLQRPAPAPAAPEPDTGGALADLDRAAGGALLGVQAGRTQAAVERGVEARAYEDRLARLQDDNLRRLEAELAGATTDQARAEIMFDIERLRGEADAMSARRAAPEYEGGLQRLQERDADAQAAAQEGGRLFGNPLYYPRALYSAAVGIPGSFTEGVGLLLDYAGAEEAGRMLQRGGRVVSDYAAEVGGVIPPEQRGFGTDVAGGIGSMGVFYAVGGAAAILTRSASPMTRGLAGFGAAGAVAGPTGATEAYNRAREFGMSHEDALAVTVYGVPAGLVQVAPVGYLLAKLPLGARSQVAHMAQAFFAEFTAESAGAMLQNVVERSYNEERGVWDDTIYQGLVGGSSAAIINGIAASLTRRGAAIQRRPYTQEEAAQIAEVAPETAERTDASRLEALRTELSAFDADIARHEAEGNEAVVAQLRSARESVITEIEAIESPIPTDLLGGVTDPQLLPQTAFPPQREGGEAPDFVAEGDAAADEMFGVPEDEAGSVPEIAPEVPSQPDAAAEAPAAPAAEAPAKAAQTGPVSPAATPPTEVPQAPVAPATAPQQGIPGVAPMPSTDVASPDNARWWAELNQREGAAMPVLEAAGLGFDRAGRPWAYIRAQDRAAIMAAVGAVEAPASPPDSAPAAQAPVPPPSAAPAGTEAAGVVQEATSAPAAPGQAAAPADAAAGTMTPQGRLQAVLGAIDAGAPGRDDISSALAYIGRDDLQNAAAAIARAEAALRRNYPDVADLLDEVSDQITSQSDAPEFVATSENFPAGDVMAGGPGLSAQQWLRAASDQTILGTQANGLPAGWLRQERERRGIGEYAAPLGTTTTPDGYRIERDGAGTVLFTPDGIGFFSSSRRLSDAEAETHIQAARQDAPKLARPTKKQSALEALQTEMLRRLAAHSQPGDVAPPTAVDVSNRPEGMRLMRKLAATQSVAERRRIADEWVLQQSRQTKNEFAVVLASDGTPLAINRGKPDGQGGFSVSVAPAVYRAVRAGEVGYVTHNHPLGTAFSGGDIIMLGYGYSPVVAVTQSGNRHEATAGPAMASIDYFGPIGAVEDARTALDDAYQMFHAVMQQRVNEGMDIPVAQKGARAMFTLALDRLGVIRYSGDAAADADATGVNFDEAFGRQRAGLVERLRRGGFPVVAEGGAGADAGAEAGRAGDTAGATDAGPGAGPPAAVAPEGPASARVPQAVEADARPSAAAFEAAGFTWNQRGGAWALPGDGRKWVIRSHPGDRFKVLRFHDNVGTVAIPTRTLGIFDSAEAAIAEARRDRGEAAPAVEPEADAPPAPAQPPEAVEASPGRPGLSNLTDAENAELAALEAQFLDKLRNQVRSGLDPELVSIGFRMGQLYVKNGARRFRQLIDTMMDRLGLSLDEAQPYARNAYNQIRDDMDLAGEDIRGMDDAQAVMAEIRSMREDAQRRDEAQDAQADDDAGDVQRVAERFRDEFRAGRNFASITEARAVARDVAGDSLSNKAIEEAIEAGVVMRAREIVGEQRAERRPMPETFDLLLSLYQAQPNLKTRTSTSVAQQAYSTPVPLAYLASRLAGINAGTRVYEPSAGNGMLLIQAAPQNIVANELNPDRAAALRMLLGAGATVTQEDGTTAGPPQPVARVIANPPFGKVKGEDGRNLRWRVGETMTGEVDHAISWRALQSMEPDGRAVLIIGSQKGDAETRQKGYRSRASMAFMNALYDNFNVTEHFSVDGRLYQRQGAAWPVDVIVIEGRGRSARPLPGAEAPPIYTEWAQLRERLDGADSLDTRTSERPAGGRDAAAPPAAPADPSGVSGGAVGQAGQAGTGRPGGASGASGRDGGVRPDATDVRRPDDGDVGVPAGQDGQPGGVAGAPAGDTAQPGDVGVPVAGGQSGAVSGDAVPRARVERANTEAETDFQVQYAPHSNARFAVGTLVPRNMQTAIDRALSGLRDRVGDIDDFVAARLGYTRDEMLGTDERPGFFSAEQVDALALAIDNVEQGRGFIVGDQTGVGKGRFVAAMLRYALQQGKTPIFVTKQPGLYADMIRDMRDIGMESPEAMVFPTNELRGKDAIPLSNAPGDTLLSPTKTKHSLGLSKMEAAGRMPDGFRMLFTTYSQMQYDPRTGEQKRQRAMRALAPNAIIVLDESHEAGGSESRAIDPDTGQPKPTRADFFREVLALASGAIYSSATYAKNPTVMSLYFKTDLSLAVENLDDLAYTISEGGVPLQQVTANMLVESGQYARRERSYEGVSMDLDVVETDAESGKGGAQALRAVFDLDRDYMEDVREKFIADLAGEGMEGGRDGSVGEQSASGTGFAQVMHVVVSQMLLSLKARGLVSAAKAAHARGEKPIVALSNTNAAILSDFMDDTGLSVGDEASVSFNLILQRYLERLRRVTVKRAGSSEKQHIYIPKSKIAELAGQDAVSAYEQVERAIETMDLSGLPASPIDYVIDALEADGIRTGEITGRQIVLRNGVLERREATDAAKKRTMNAYNSGELDALVINKSGSTGFSMHAQDRAGNDGKMRRMFIVQPDPNIDVFMQMLGRIHRTGQSRLPGYSILVSDLAVEKRLAAILMRKMASLNANTTASKRGAVSLDNVTDFMNKYGDKVVADILNDNPELAAMLNVAFDGKPKDGLAAKVTGRMAIMEPEVVADVYEQIEAAYREYIEALDSMGLNTLEAKTLDLDARTLSTAELVPGRADEASPFAQPAFMSTVDVKKIGKPMTSAQVQERVAQAMEGETASQIIDRLDALMPAHEARTEANIQRAREAQAEAKTEKQKVRAADALLRHERALETGRAKLAEIKEQVRRHAPGKAFFLSLGEGDAKRQVAAVVIGVDTKGIKANPLAASSIKFDFAIADAGRQVRVSLSQLIGESEYSTAEMGSMTRALAAFDAGQSEARETRQMITGNLLSGFAKFKKGQIVLFTDNEGSIQRGILMPATFDATKEMAKLPVKFSQPSHVARFLSEAPGQRAVKSSDGILAITYERGGFVFQAASKGGKPYYLSPGARQVLGDFVRSGQKGAFRARARTAAEAESVIEVYQRTLGTEFQTEVDKEAARLVTGETLPSFNEDAPAPMQRAPSQPVNVTPADTAEVRQNAMTRALNSQPIDKAIRLPFIVAGGLDQRGQWKPGVKLSEAAERLIWEAKPREDGFLDFLNPVLETVRAGVLDRYGLPQGYVEADRVRGLDERRVMANVPELMGVLKAHKVGRAEAKVLHDILTGQRVADKDMALLAEPIRLAVDELGQEAVDLGLLAPEAYERNRGSYLHRVYMKHEGDLPTLARFFSSMRNRRQRKIVGDQFKGRGIWHRMDEDTVLRRMPEAFRTRPQKGDKLRMLDLIKENDDDSVEGSTKPRVLRRALLPANVPVPQQYRGYTDRGVFEVREDAGNKLTLWRDYTRVEREQMGEIMDARYTIAKTFMVMARDLSTGRFFKKIAENPEWSQAQEPPAGTWKDSQEYRWKHWGDPEVQWVRVPDTTIRDSRTKRYGALAGQFVRAEIWRDLNELESMQNGGLWQQLLTQWKLNKTARSPVVHMNNVMSNVMLMDMADVRTGDLTQAIAEMARGGELYQEAVDNGAFGSDMISQEIRRSVLEPVLAEIQMEMRNEARAEQEGWARAAGVVGRLYDGIFGALKAADRKMVEMYQLEDEVFRLATFIRRRAQGISARDAALEARDQFLNYDVRAPWVNAARRTVLPFLSYTYRAVPIVAKTVAVRPWKVAKYITVTYALGQLAYAMAPSDWDEEQERASFRDQERGNTWAQTPRLMRMPWVDEFGNPVFLDIRRWIPAGDVFDMNQGNGAVPLPAWLQLGGPLVVGMELAVFNRSAFTGDEIYNPLTDTLGERLGKSADHLWKSWMPSAAWVPNSWYQERITNAMIGARDRQGREYSVPQALASSVGIKLRPQDVRQQMAWRAADFDRAQRALQLEARQILDARSRGMISEAQFHRRMENATRKLEQLADRRQERLEAFR